VRRVGKSRLEAEQFDKSKVDTDRTYVLVRNDFDILNMAGGLENLPEHILCNTWIKPSDIQRALVRFWGSTTHEAASAAWRHHPTRHWRCDGSRDRVRVLRDDDGRQRRRRHVGRIALTTPLAIIILMLTGCSNGWLRRWRER